MARAVNVLARAAARPQPTTHHSCPFEPCHITLAGVTAACKTHREQLPAPLRRALIAAWNQGRGKESAEFANALEAAVAALEAKRAGQS